MADRIYTVNELVENLGALTGQTVSVHGMLRVGREHRAIWHLPETEQHGQQSCLWALFHHATLGTRERQLREFDRRCVTATDVLDVSRKGHFSQFPGTITIRSMTFDESHAATMRCSA
ncbi:MAG: hypothetical protein U1F83_09930 [Verrucomicrobiota bacterium]